MRNHESIKQFDKQREEWQAITSKYGRPKTGWVRTLRKTLGMTAEQLAKRLGLKRARIVQLEKAEIQDAVTLRALKAAAEAMDCKFVYAIIPKTSLETIFQNRAKEIISQNNPDLPDEQQEILIKNLLKNSSKKLWD